MSRRLSCLLAVLTILGSVFIPSSALRAATGTSTTVQIQGTQFLLNGQPSYAGTAVQGLLLNSRMIQGLFDDENPSTAGNWAYPDTRVWDPQRNTTELVAALPSYAANGLRMITVGLQGGCPRCDSVNGQNITTAFTADGALKSAWFSRLAQLLHAAAQSGIVVDLSLFYYKQDYRLSSEAAVSTAISSTMQWLVAGGYHNVLVEIANECNIGNFYPILSCDAQTIAQAQHAGGGTIPVSISYTGGAIPSDAVMRQEDFITVHGNGQSPGGISSMVSQIKATAAYQAQPKPIVFNEDSTSLANLDAAVAAEASWGYYDQGSNDYYDGYQSPPVNWGINTSSKQAFFAHVAALTGAGSGTSTATPTASATATQTATAPPPPPPASLAVKPARGAPFQTIALTGTTFGPSEPVALYWDRISTTPLATTTTTASGSFQARIRLPQAVVGYHLLLARGRTSSRTAVAFVRIVPRLIVVPASGAVGTRVAIIGVGFAAGTWVAAYWDKPRSLLGLGLSNGVGSVSMSTTIPLSSAGFHVVYGVGWLTYAVGTGLVAVP